MFVPDVHEHPIANSNSYGLREWVDVHTYRESELALIDVHGDNMDSIDQSIDLWLTEDQVRALRDALNKVLGD